MSRLRFGCRPFAFLVRCTATADCLREMAEALEAGGAAGLERKLSKYTQGATVRPGAKTRVEALPGIRLTLARDDCEKLAHKLRWLVVQPERSRFSLAELCVLPRQFTEYDLEFYKLQQRRHLKRDYDTEGVAGGTWEGVLYHGPPTLEQLHQVRGEFLGWVRPAPDAFEQDLFAQSSEGNEQTDLATAHRRLLAANDTTYQINIYGEHPLVVPYGSPHTEAKLWLYADSSEILVSQHCCWSGDLEVDVENFLSYRGVLRTLIEILNPTRFALGENADNWPIDQTSPPESLDDETAMWECFTMGLWEVHGSNPPAPLRDLFAQAWAQLTPDP